MTRFSSTFCQLSLSILILSSRAFAQPDLIIHNAKIVTVDDRFSIAEALAVEGERIQEVGKNVDIVKLAGAKTRIINLKAEQ